MPMDPPTPEPPPAVDRVEWLLAHPAASPWLKAALRSSQDCDPVTLLNDLEMLRFALGGQAEQFVARLLRQDR